MPFFVNSICIVLNVCYLVSRPIMFGSSYLGVENEQIVLYNSFFGKWSDMDIRVLINEYVYGLNI